MTKEHPRDILVTMDVRQDVGTYEPRYLVMRLQFRRDGSVTWTSIPLEDLYEHHLTYSTKYETVIYGQKQREWN